MLSKILNILKIVPKSERTGEEIDYNNAWIIDSVNDKFKFLAWLFKNVPSNSIWAIEGIYEKSIIDFLVQYSTNDSRSITLGTIWPKQKFLKILLSDMNKNKILMLMKEWDLSIDLMHQHIYKDDHFYFTSFDNLHPCCTWLSKRIPIGELEKLKTDNIIDFYEERQLQ